MLGGGPEKGQGAGAWHRSTGKPSSGGCWLHPLVFTRRDHPTAPCVLTDALGADAIHLDPAHLGGAVQLNPPSLHPVSRIVEFQGN